MHSMIVVMDSLPWGWQWSIMIKEEGKCDTRVGMWNVRGGD